MDRKRNDKPNVASGGKATNHAKAKPKERVDSESKSKLTPKSILKNWEDDLRTKLGKQFRYASQIILTGRIPSVRPPEQLNAALMRQTAIDEETQRQVEAGVAADAVVINFPASTYDQVIDAYHHGDHELYQLVHGLGNADSARLNTFFNTIFQEDLKLYRQEIRDLKNELPLIYNSILDEIGKESKDRLKTHRSVDWNALETEQNPAELIKAIRVAHTLEPTGSKSINQLNARRSYERLVMSENESPEAFKVRFQNAMDIRYQLGLDEISEEEQAQDFLSKLFKPIYGELLHEIERDDITGKKNYPVSLAEAYDIVVSYRPKHRPQRTSSTVFSVSDESGSTGSRTKNRNKNLGPGSGSGLKNGDECTGSSDKHEVRSKNRAVSGRDSAPGKTVNKIKCYICKGPHKVDHCPNRKAVEEFLKSREEDDNDVANWVEGNINCVICNELSNELQNVYSTQDDNRSDDGHLQEWSNVTIVYLDNCADTSVFNNPNLVTDFKPIRHSIGGVDASQPGMLCEGIGKFLSAFPVNIARNARQNLWSEGTVVKMPGWSIWTDNKNYDKTVLSPNGEKYLFKLVGRRWCRDFANDLLINWVASVETVLENELMYNKKEVERAKLAKILTRRMGYPSAYKLINMIERGVLNNCPVTAKDVIRALKIYGIDIFYLKGKETHRSVTFEEAVSVPRLIDKKQVLYFDNMFIVKMCFLISVSKPMGLITVTPLGKHSGTRSAVNLKEAIRQHINVYAKYGFIIAEVHSDSEAGIVAEQEWLANHGIAYVPNPEDVKVGIVENGIKRIKNTARCILHSVPFHLSYILLIWLVCYSVYCINFQISRVGREGLCPRQELTGIRPDVKRDFRVGFCDFAECFQKSAGNSMDQRTVGAIALCPTGSQTGAVKFLSLASGKVITRNQFKILPIPKEYILFMNEWAKLKADVPGDLSTTWGKYLEIDNMDDDEGPEVDGSLPLLLQRYQSPAINVDAPRIPESVIHPDFTEHRESHTGGSVVNSEKLPAASTAVAAAAADVRATERSEPNVDVLADSGVPLLSDDEQQSDEKIMHLSAGVTAAAAGPEKTVNGKITDTLAPNILWIGGHDKNGNNYVFNMTLTKSIQLHGEKAKEAAKSEIMQLHNKPVWRGIEPIKSKLIPKSHIIHGKLFMKDKLNINRVLEKIKGRYVSRGDQVPIELRDYVDSPTVSAEALFIMLAIFAKEDRHIVGYDVPAAYLNAQRDPSSKKIYMRLNKDITNIILENDVSFAKFVDANGTSVVEIIRALYGLSDSSGLWYQEVSKFLKSIGFKENDVIPCVFNKIIDGSQCTIMLYVDDMLIAHVSSKEVKAITDALDAKYGKGTISDGKVIQFLGMKIEKEGNGVIAISMPKHIEELLEDWNIQSTSEYPAGYNLFEVKDDSPLLSEEMASKFHSGVASALYISKRGPRPDILLPINYLATRVQSPAEDDLKKFIKVLKYLNGSKDLVMRLYIGKTNVLYLYVDASYGVHSKGQSHTGSVLKYGLATIQVKSSKQKVVAKSSCESELIGASDEAGQLLHMNEFLEAQGYSEENPVPGVLFQDNQAAIRLEQNGKKSSNRTKHISIRNFWIKDQVRLGKIEVRYLKTTEMIADLLTKPVQGELFYKLRKLLMNEK